MTVEQVTWTLVALQAATLFGAFFYLGNKIDALGARLDARLAHIEARIDSMSARIDGLAAQIADHISRPHAS